MRALRACRCAQGAGSSHSGSRGRIIPWVNTRSWIMSWCRTDLAVESIYVRKKSVVHQCDEDTNTITCIYPCLSSHRDIVCVRFTYSRDHNELHRFTVFAARCCEGNCTGVGHMCISACLKAGYMSLVSSHAGNRSECAVRWALQDRQLTRTRNMGGGVDTWVDNLVP